MLAKLPEDIEPAMPAGNHLFQLNINGSTRLLEGAAALFTIIMLQSYNDSLFVQAS